MPLSETWFLLVWQQYRCGGEELCEASEQWVRHVGTKPTDGEGEQDPWGVVAPKCVWGNIRAPTICYKAGVSSFSLVFVSLSRVLSHAHRHTVCDEEERTSE